MDTDSTSWARPVKQRHCKWNKWKRVRTWICCFFKVILEVIGWKAISSHEVETCGRHSILGGQGLGISLQIHSWVGIVQVPYLVAKGFFEHVLLALVVSERQLRSWLKLIQMNEYVQLLDMNADFQTGTLHTLLQSVCIIRINYMQQHATLQISYFMYVCVHLFLFITIYVYIGVHTFNIVFIVSFDTNMGALISTTTSTGWTQCC